MGFRKFANKIPRKGIHENDLLGHGVYAVHDTLWRSYYITKNTKKLGYLDYLLFLVLLRLK